MSPVAEMGQKLLPQSSLPSPSSQHFPGSLMLYP